jgi:hypothetical protein
VFVSVPLAFGLAYVIADSVAAALARLHELQLWIAVLALLIVAGWLLVHLHRRRG